MRLGFVATGLVLFRTAADVYVQGQPAQFAFTLALSFIVWALGMALVIFAALPEGKPRLVWLVLAGAIVAQLAYAYLSWLNYSPLTGSHTDNEMIAQYAVQVLRRGENPYLWNFSDMLRVFRDQGLNYTPFLDGAIQNRVTYPAFPTELLLLFDLVGLGSVRLVSVLAQLVLFVLLFIGAPAKIKPLVLLPIFAFADFINLPMQGVQDVVWSALLLAMILAWSRPIWRAIFFGLAVSFRQQPWFVAPFLLIYLWKGESGGAERGKGVLQFVAISAGIFLITNLPFIVWDPMSWAMGAFEPSYAAFNMYSHGLGALSQYGLASFPREFYSLLQASFYLIALVVYWRHTKGFGQAFWIFPGIFFWLYYRGLDNYWIYWIPPLVFAVGRFLKDQTPTAWNDQSASTGWNRTIAFSLSVFLGVQVVAVALLTRNAPIQATYTAPLQTFEYGGPLVNQIKVNVENLSDATLEPRFAVQHDPGMQAMPWSIESGPETLDAGQSAEYVISADGLPAKALPASEGGQIVISDASGSYWERAVVTIPADPSYKNPDLVKNANFALWPIGAQTPEGWTLENGDGRKSTVTIESVAGRSALVLHTTSSDTQSPKALGSGPNQAGFAARLEQQITFPDSLSIWVRPPAASAQVDSYGLDFDDGVHKLWVAFGDTASPPEVVASPQAMLAAPRAALAASQTAMATPPEVAGQQAAVRLYAPAETWTRQTIPLRDIYDRLGWSLPSPTSRKANGLEYAARQVQLSLVGSSSSGSKATGSFGAIEEDAAAFSANALVADVLDHPDVYYTSRGEVYLRQRNHTMAQASYEQAIVYNPKNADAYYGLAESRYELGDYTGAAEAFAKSSALGAKVSSSKLQVESQK